MSNSNDLIEIFRETVAKDKDYNMKCEAEFDVLYPTGFLNLDFLNGQRIFVQDSKRSFSYDSIGIVDGSFNLFIGRNGCGKSTMVKQFASNIIRPFPLGKIFEDSIEGGITQRRNEILTGFGPNEIISKLLSRNAGITIENVYKRIRLIYEIKISHVDEYRYDTGYFDSRGNRVYKLQPTIYIIDSLAMLIPEKLTKEEEVSGQMSTTATAKLLAAFFRRVTPMLKTANIILFVINHITQDVNLSVIPKQSKNIYLKPGETCPGGETPFYLANNIFRLDDNNKLKEDKEFYIAGNFVTVTMVKSRTNRAGASTDLVFNQDIGYDADLSLFIYLKKHGKVNGAGAYLYLGDRDDLKFSQKNFKNKLYEDNDFKQVFINECISLLRESLNKEQIKIMEEHKSNTSNDILKQLQLIQQQNIVNE